MNTQKGFAPILLILAGLIVVGGGVYFYITKTNKNNTELISGNEIQDATTTNDLVKNNQTVNRVATTTESSKQITTKDNDVLSARDVLEIIQKIYSPNSVIENNVEGYNGRNTKGYRLIVESKDVGNIEKYLQSSLLLKTIDASELGYTFDNSNEVHKSTFQCITSTGRPEVETESGFFSATEAFVFCNDIK